MRPSRRVTWRSGVMSNWASARAHSSARGVQERGELVERAQRLSLASRNGKRHPYRRLVAERPNLIECLRPVEGAHESLTATVTKDLEAQRAARRGIVVGIARESSSARQECRPDWRPRCRGPPGWSAVIVAPWGQATGHLRTDLSR